LRRPPRARSGNHGRLGVANTVSSHVKKLEITQDH